MFYGYTKMPDSEKILREIEAIKLKLEGLERRLFGNGEEGLIERVRQLELEITKLKAAENTKRKDFNVFTALLQLGIGLIGALFGAGIIWRVMN